MHSRSSRYEIIFLTKEKPMHRSLWIILGILSIALFAGCTRESPASTVATQTSPTVSPNPAPPVQWEYAELSSTQVSNSNSNSVRWEDSVEVVEASGYAEMAKKLGYEATSNTSTEGNTTSPNRTDSTIILNHLGSKGWELVTQTHSVVFNPSSGANAILISWTFKRPKR
jgi:hypothetical protein